MKNDPIVEEVHRIRQQIWDECGGTLESLVASLRASEANHPDRIQSVEQLDQIQKKVAARTSESS